MLFFIFKRLMMLVPTVFGVVTLVFMLRPMIPGDPIDYMLGENAMEADREMLRAQYGLDKSLPRQYLVFLGGLVKGDLGRSIHTRRPVTDMIRERYPATLLLALSAMVVAVLVALPAGIASAVKRNSLVDNLSMLGALLGISMPNFWMGPLLIILFSIHLGWLPVSGMGGPLYLILPAITLGTSMAAILTRMTRSSMLEVINEDYVTTAKAKGLSRGKVIFKHALKNAVIPLLTLVGLQFGALLAGSIITETIFAWPGVGSLVVTAIYSRDFPLLQGLVMTISLTYVVINLLTDLFYAVADPRIRLGGPA
jgi:peptide/nickel transport system permease protein